MNPHNLSFSIRLIFADRIWRHPGRGRSVFFLSIVLLGLSIGCCPGHQNPFLYGAGPKEFVQRGPVEVYNRSTLFDYMDGEAEVYLPLGFTLLYTGRYRKPGTDAVILLEAYDMGSSRGARAIFAVYTREGGAGVQGIGDAAWTDKSVILFRRDRYFFRVRPDPTAETDLSPVLSDLIGLSRDMDRMTAQIQQP